MQNTVYTCLYINFWTESNKNNFKTHRIIYKVQVDKLIKDKYIMKVVKCCKIQYAHVYISIFLAESNKNNFITHRIIYKVQMDELINDKYIMKVVKC